MNAWRTFEKRRVRRFRTGVEADEAFRVERHGIGPIPPADRHGHPRELFWVWLGSGIVFASVIGGSIVVDLGLTFWEAVAAVVLGVVPFALVGLGATVGPRTGTTTMIVSRAAFGLRGNGVPTLMSWITVVGWEAVFVVIGTLALQRAALEVGMPDQGWVRAVCFAAVMAVTFAIAFWGHATIVVAQRLLSIMLGVGSLFLVALILPQADPSFRPPGPMGSSHLGGWLLGLTIVAAGPFSWLNYPADYSRYLPAATPARPVAIYTAIGAAIPALVLTSVGVAAASATDMSDPIAGIARLTPAWFLLPYLLVIVGGSITNNVLNTYSSGLNLLALGLRAPRTLAVTIDAVLAGVASAVALFVFDFTQAYVEFLSLMLLWIAPWSGVFFADMLARRSTYRVWELFVTRQYGDASSRGGRGEGIIALVTGVVTAAMFTTSPLFVGPLASTLDGGDLSIPVGFTSAFLTYTLLVRRSSST